ncbi:unnamed protein product [Schistosoma mansoni]|uniref:Smp_204460 n=1 Tax=Schistosoma mansoni TaxID=6183 RepID=UPI00022C8395|nr:unnamed protein product [Schistosoma mansoni]|eukprot:XP_018646074.1 unnamed protein product [Schistosoma mansoni]
MDTVSAVHFTFVSIHTDIRLMCAYRPLAHRWMCAASSHTCIAAHQSLSTPSLRHIFHKIPPHQQYLYL